MVVMLPTSPMNINQPVAMFASWQRKHVPRVGCAAGWEAGGGCVAWATVMTTVWLLDIEGEPLSVAVKVTM